MKKLLTIMLCIAAFATGMQAQENARITADGATTSVTFYSPEIVRVVRTPEGSQGNTREGWVVTMEPQDVNVRKSENSSAITLRSDVVTVRIDKKTGLVQFMAKGKNMLKEKSYGFEERTSGPDAGSYMRTS